MKNEEGLARRPEGGSQFATALPIIDSYPRLAADPSVSARYCALVSRDPEAPRSRRALHGRGRQFLELRSQVCGTITTVQKDTLVWIERT